MPIANGRMGLDADRKLLAMIGLGMVGVAALGRGDASYVPLRLERADEGVGGLLLPDVVLLSPAYLAARWLQDGLRQPAAVPSASD